jgi:spore germination protein
VGILLSNISDLQNSIGVIISYSLYSANTASPWKHKFLYKPIFKWRLYMEIYVTHPGDTLAGLAKAYGISADSIAKLNQLNDPQRLVPGLSLLLPVGREHKPIMAELSAALSPGAESALREEMLPALTWLCVQSASFTADGQIFMPEAQKLLEAAKAKAVTPLLVLSNLGSSGFFSQLAHKIITDSVAAKAMAERLPGLLEAQGYGGMAVNFQYVPDFDRQALTDFVGGLSVALHRAGFYLFCYLPPKPGAHDFKALAECADRLILLCHGYGGVDTPPQAIAPITQLSSDAEQAVALVPPEKLLLSVSAYGCSWALPWRSGARGEYLSCRLAVDMAIAGGFDIKLDRAAIAPFFTVSSGSDGRLVRYEDCRSIVAKLNVVQRLGLGGLELYTGDRLYRPALKLVQDRFWGHKLI